MSQIKQINTGVAELLAVKVPEEATKFHFNYEAGFKDRISYMPKNGLHFVETSRLPPGNWTPLGIDTELTEEQCREILPMKKTKLAWDDFLTPMYLDYVNSNKVVETAKESFYSLIQAHDCTDGTWLVLKRL